MPDRRRRAGSRRHRARRTIRWIRALGPILLLLAAGLLSAGVVQVVELATSGTPPTPAVERRGSAERPGSPRVSPRKWIDLDAFDRELYRELQKLDDESRGRTTFAPPLSEREILRVSLGTSHLGGRYDDAIRPFRSEIRANPLFEGPAHRDAASEPATRGPGDRRTAAPEPGIGLLVFTGLGSLARRSLRPL